MTTLAELKSKKYDIEVELSKYVDNIDEYDINRTDNSIDRDGKFDAHIFELRCELSSINKQIKQLMNET